MSYPFWQTFMVLHREVRVVKCLGCLDSVCSWGSTCVSRTSPETRDFKAFRKAQVLLGSSRSWIFIATALWRVSPQNITFPATAPWL